jgi:peptidoglycan/xylan/chitin deacetylase (PgdA/CDA1 family)
MKHDFRKVIGLKVDVDTYEGMKNGVPKLLDCLNQFNIKASFFVPMGRDHTGWTVKRVFTRRGFLKKANRVGVLETYGMRTLMYGLLLPGPKIAEKNRSVLREIVEQGHEAGIHGYDHVIWHDRVKEWDDVKTSAILIRACRKYEDILGVKAHSFAAPGWMINPYALQFFENNGFLYSSDTRGVSPFLPIMGDRPINILQIPTTLPTLDEVVGIEGSEPRLLAGYFKDLLSENLNIITIHTELEGKRWLGFLMDFIRLANEQGFTFMRLTDIAQMLKGKNSIPRCKIFYGHVEGRAGEVSCQKPSDLS